MGVIFSKSSGVIYKKAWGLLGDGVAIDPDSLAGELIYLQTPFGLLMSSEFLGTYFVTREAPTDANETIYQFYTNF